MKAGLFITLVLVSLVVVGVFVYLTTKSPAEREETPKDGQSELTDRERFYNEVYILRHEGLPFSQIAKRLGISKTSAIRNYKRAVEWMKNYSKK